MIDANGYNLKRGDTVTILGGETNSLWVVSGFSDGGVDIMHLTGRRLNRMAYNLVKLSK